MHKFWKSLGIAAILSGVAAVGLHVYDCHVGPHEACLMSRGLLWVYWLGILVLVGLPVVFMVSAARGWLRDVSKRGKSTVDPK